MFIDGHLKKFVQVAKLGDIVSARVHFALPMPKIFGRELQNCDTLHCKIWLVYSYHGMHYGVSEAFLSVTSFTFCFVIF